MRDAAWQSRAKNLGSVPDGGLRGRDSTPLGLCGLHSPGRRKETHHRRSLWAFSGIIVPGQSGHTTWHGGARCHTPRMGPPPLHSSEPSDATANCEQNSLLPGTGLQTPEGSPSFLLLFCAPGHTCRYSGNRSVTRRTLTPQTYAQTDTGGTLCCSSPPILYFRSQELTTGRCPLVFADAGPSASSALPPPHPPAPGRSDVCNPRCEPPQVCATSVPPRLRSHSCSLLRRLPWAPEAACGHLHHATSPAPSNYICPDALKCKELAR